MVLAQTKKITGTVKDATGVGVPGVTILIEGGGAKTQTDGDGKFTITAKPGDVLITKYISHTDGRITVDQRSNYNITIKEEANSLNEVVVVGFGTQKRSSVSGSISTIDKKVLQNRPVNNTIEALQGTAPGLVITRGSGQPGREGWNINIRGLASINGTNSPLVIVDGIEYADIAMLNPNDIENISVLKDAAAAAIYGAKAANGVLLVTTKQGSKTGKVTVSYTGLYQLKHTLNVPERLNSWEEATLQNLANFNNNGGSASWKDQQIAWMQDPTQSFQPNDPNNVFYYYNEDLAALTLRKNYFTHNQNLSVSGGNDKTNYFISFGYNNNKGVFKIGPDNNDRYNGRFNINTKFSKIFSLDSRLNFTKNTIRRSPSTGAGGDYGLIYNILNIRRIYPAYNPDGTLFSGNTGATIALLESGGIRTTTNSILDGVFTLKADNIAKGLVLSATYSPHLQQDNEDVSIQTVPLYAWNKASQKFAQSSYLNPTNSIAKQRTTQISYSANALADYTLNLGDHHFQIVGGFQYQDYNYDRIGARNTNLVNNDLLSLNYTTLPNLPITAIGDNIQTNTWVSVFSRLNYNYKEKYYIEATVRNDGTSRLAPGFKSQTFPGLSAAWRISQEKWFSDNVKFINELKLRASYGALGNGQLSEYDYQRNYDYIAQLSSGTYPFNNAANTTIYQNTLPSPAVGWETIKTYDVGLNVTMLNNRLTADFDYFKRINNGMQIQVVLPALLGVSPSTTNGASMYTKGWEFNASWRDKIGELTYSAGFNVSDNINKLTRYDGAVVYNEGENDDLPGYSINSIFGYKTLGYFQTQEEVTNSPKQFASNNQGPGDYKYADINGDGIIGPGAGTAENPGDLTYLGNTNPRYSYGINLGAEWKGFDASVFFQGVAKRNIRLYAPQVLPFVNSWRYPVDDYRDNYWTPSRPNALYPRPLSGGGTNTRVNSALVQNAAYIRLKNVQLGYTLPSALTKKVNIERVRIFFTGQDMWTATKVKFKYYDPENPDNAGFNYPYAATYAFGLNVTF